MVYKRCAWCNLSNIDTIAKFNNLDHFYCCQFYNFNNFDSALGSQNISIFSRDRVDSVDNIDNVDNIDTYFYYLLASRWWGKSKGDRA